MKNKKYVALVELFDENCNSDYKSFDFCASNFYDAYEYIIRKLLEDYIEYNFEVITIHRCFPRGE